MKDWCRPMPGGVSITVQVTPNAKRTEVIGVLDEVVKIRLQAQPVEGKANDAMLRYLSIMLDVPKSGLTISRGLTHRVKTVEISAPSMAPETVRRILLGSCAKKSTGCMTAEDAAGKTGT
ncbi:MAG: hypothetical protein JWQ00_2107 [Noviherbaspirillum sp.]|nr:hypothetical protein [Noviherbaspirillum sp.]